MKDMNRRDVLVALSALAALGGVATAEGQGLNGVVPSSDKVLSESEVFPFDKLPVNQNANGGQTRNVVTGVLVTGEAVEIHETTLPPGKMPHPPHKHQHSEFMMVREGELEFNNDGKLSRVGPGGVTFAASNVMHGVKSVGKVPANYFVIAIGRQNVAANA
jgi:mannose-6-phosphate isomerase-like protein (cupin superfamily)